MTKKWSLQVAGAAVSLIALIAASTAYADQWNDRTILTFSEPVMVPNATLAPGTYVFQLADVKSNRHLVQIFNEDETRLITTTQAIPTRRQQQTDDIIVQFNPTEPGTPVALKSWFSPASSYGHEFVYPEDQARQIAERTKTIVLSVDVPDSDLQRGVLRRISPSGESSEWHGDAATEQEWTAWNRSRTAAAANTDSEERRQASAPAVQAAREGMRVDLDDLEDNPRKYTGQRISVDAEVEKVFGPRLFTIDEPNWADLDGEILVLMPTSLAAVVQEDDRVTITGTVQSFLRADVEREWGWLGLDREVEVKFSQKPVLRADRIVGGDDDFAMFLELSSPPSRAGAGAARDEAVGTAGSSSAPTSASASAGAVMPIADLAQLAHAGKDTVGRSVSLGGARVTGTDSEGGYFIGAGGDHVFVLPADDDAPAVRPGDMVTVHGRVLRMPRGMEDHLMAPGNLNHDIYIFATQMSK